VNADANPARAKAEDLAKQTCTEFGRNVMCSSRMVAGNFDKSIYQLTATCWNGFAKDTLLIIVQTWIEVHSSFP
jgi:hypothetical protein